MPKQTTVKPPLAIIAPHPAHGGGVLSSLKIVYEFCQRYFAPKVYCLSFLPSVAMSLRSFRFTSSAREFMYDDMRCVEIGARWARWEPGHYWFTRGLWKHYFKPYRYVFVTGGTPHVAHPAVLFQKKFILWLASTFFDDRKHRLEKASWSEQLLEKVNLPFMNAIERQVLKQATVLLPISSYTKKLCDDILGFERDGVRIAPVPVDVKGYEKSSLSGSLRVIAVGRFTDPRKNLKMLLDVCEKLLGTDVRFCVDIVGVYPKNHPDVIRLSVKFASRIIFHGFSDQKTLDELYRKAFVSVITSDQEGLGIVGLDALSWGIPVITTRCGGVIDYVKPGISGFLVEPDDVCEMVESIKVLANNPELYFALSAGALRLVRTCFSKESVFIRFQWALVQAYPELAALFTNADVQEIGIESFSRRPCLSFSNQS